MVALAVALSLLAAVPAWGAEPAVRAGTHDGFGRLVFEWSTPVEVDGRQEGDRYRVRFGRPLDASLDRALDHLDDYLERAEPGRSDQEIVLHLVPGTKVRREVYDGRIVVLDLVRAAGGNAKVGLRTGVHDGFGRIVFDWSRPVTYEATTDAERVGIRFNRAGEIDAATLGKRLGAWLERGHATQREGRSEVRLDLMPGVRARVFKVGDDRVVVDLHGPDAQTALGSTDSEGGASPPARAAASPPAPTPEPRMPPPQAVAAGPPLPELTITAAASDGGAQVDFAWDRPVPAAVFVRAGYLWTVFAGQSVRAGELTPPRFPPLVRNYLGRGKLVEATGGTAIRFPLRQPLAAEAERAGTVWRVRLSLEVAPPDPLSPIRLSAPLRLRLAPGENAQLVTFADPEVGDRLEVWPLLMPGLGQIRQRTVDLELLATAQGLVWRLLRDGIRAQAEDQVVEFVAPGGLLLSDETDVAPLDVATEDSPAATAAAVDPPRAEADPSDRAAPPPPLAPTTAAAAAVARSPAEPTMIAESPLASPFGLAGWGLTTTPTMVERRRGLLRELEASVPDRRDPVRLELARLYLAQGLAAETLGILGVMGGSEDAGVRLARRALAGAAAVLMGRLGEAEAGLGARELDGDPEVALWRAALAAAGEDWSTAARELERSEQILTTYPLALQPRLGLPAARIAIEAGDPEATIGLLEQLDALELDRSDRARVAFLQALAEARAGGTESADRIWLGLEEGAPAETRIKATYERARLLLDRGELEPAKALAILAPARGLWRGLPDEHAMLDGLAQVYARAGDHPSAVRTWRDLLARFPDAPEAEQVRIRMRQTLIKALLEEDGPPLLGPVQAYALHQEFEHLLPGGELGDHLRRRLAARLAALDLIRPAAALLESLIAGRPGSVARVETGADLAELWLREPAPEAALGALDQTRAAAALPAPLRDRRRLLRARALADLGRRSEALTLLEGLGRAAGDLRVAILSRSRDWGGLVAAIEPLLDATSPDGAPLAEDDQRLAVALAVAHARLGRTEALERLRARFGAAMRGQPAEPAFLMATATPGSATAPETVLAVADQHLRRVQDYLDTQPLTN